MARDVKQLPSLHHVAVPAQPWLGLEAALAQGVPAARLAVVARQRQPRDRVARLLGSALLAAAARRHGLAFDPWSVQYPQGGPLYWPGWPVCSLSHSADHVVLLLGPEAPVGVDVESPGAVSAADLRLALPVSLREAVAAGTVDATDAWMQAEAALKAAGVGLSGLPDVVFASAGRARVRDLALVLRPVSLGGGAQCWCALGEAWAERPIQVVGHQVADLVRLLESAQPLRIPAP